MMSVVVLSETWSHAEECDLLVVISVTVSRTRDFTSTEVTSGSTNLSQIAAALTARKLNGETSCVLNKFILEQCVTFKTSNSKVKVNLSP